MSRKRKRGLGGPARAYRRKAAGRWYSGSMGTQKTVAEATRVGCRDAVYGEKHPYKKEAHGHVAAYREGYRICNVLYHGSGRLTRADQDVANRLHLESEIQFSPLRRDRR